MQLPNLGVDTGLSLPLALGELTNELLERQNFSLEITGLGGESFVDSLEISLQLLKLQLLRLAL